MSLVALILLGMSILANLLMVFYLIGQKETPEAFTYLLGFFGMQGAYVIFTQVAGAMPDSINDFLYIALHLCMAAGLTLYAVKIYNKKLSWDKILPMVLIFGSLAFGWTIALSLTHSTLTQTITAKGTFTVALMMAAIATLKEGLNRKSIGFYVFATALGVTSIAEFIGVTPLKSYFSIYSPAYLSMLSSLGLILVIENMLTDKIGKLEGTVKKDSATLKQIILSAPMPIVLSRLKDDKILMMNEKAKSLFGDGKTKMSDFHINPETRKDLLEQIEKDKIVDNFEVLMRLNGTQKKEAWMLQSARLVDYGNDIVIYASFQDITHRKMKEIELFDQATKDPLTNTYNRRQFEEIAAKEFSRSKRTERPFCLLMLDADHFKKINDTYTHATGDLVLKKLAECCKKNIRDSDSVSRFGGEEFVVMLPETPVETAVKVAEKLRKKIADMELTATNGKKFKFTVSIGVASSDGQKSVDAILQRADEALYEAKEMGRNKVVSADGRRNLEKQSLTE